MQAQEVIMIKAKRSKRPRFSLTTSASSSSAAELSGGSFAYDAVSGFSDRVTLSTPSHSGNLTQSSVEDEEDMAKCLILLAKGSSQPEGHTAAPPASSVPETYQCKTCSKSFPSFQALGGHRASHKKPNNNNNNKPILAVDDKRQDDFRSNGRDDGSNIVSLQVSNKCRVHECSICGAEFASGQALGGHMRRHRPIPAASSGREEFRGIKRPRNMLSLDLNLPAPEDDRMETNKFPFAAQEQVIIFSASPLVDCHY